MCPSEVFVRLRFDQVHMPIRSNQVCEEELLNLKQFSCDLSAEPELVWACSWPKLVYLSWWGEMR